MTRARRIGQNGRAMRVGDPGPKPEYGRRHGGVVCTVAPAGRFLPGQRRLPGSVGSPLATARAVAAVNFSLATAIPLLIWATAAAVPNVEPGDPRAVIPAIRLSKSD